MNGNKPHILDHTLSSTSSSRKSDLINEIPAPPVSLMLTFDRLSQSSGTKPQRCTVEHIKELETRVRPAYSS